MIIIRFSDPELEKRGEDSEWVREQAAAGFAQFDTGEFESVTREELMSRLARRHAPDA